MIRAKRRGLLGERLAELYLRLKGYHILGRRLRLGGSEIDLLVRRSCVLVLVEVKHRSSRSKGLHALTHAQQDRICRAARALIARYPDFAKFDIRFDLIVIASWRFPLHLVNAWGPKNDHFR